jgi:glycosyltransferase involved in cell wall biosynthesis
MRIVIVSESLSVGGAEGQAVLSAVELAKLGHDVEIVTYYPGNHYEDVLSTHEIPVVVVEAPGPFRFKRVTRMAREFKRFNADVAHGFGVISGRYVQMAGRLAGVACLYSGGRDTLIRSSYCRLTGALLTRGRRSAGWIANSSVVKEAVIENFGISEEKVHVVPNGVSMERLDSDLTPDQARQKWEIDADSAILTMVANLRSEKNHAMALRVVQKVLMQHPNAVLLLAGGGPEQERVEHMIDEWDLASHVKLLGRCSEVADLFRATDVAVLTSLREGLPNTLIEASCAGVPCVSTDNGGASDVIVDGETGYLVPIDDVDAMSQRILELLDDRTRRDRMGQAAASYARNKFSPEALGRNLVDVYERGLEMVGMRR